ncbi:MAG: BatA domain-containing protein [Gemmataceae bacterium]
MPGSIGFAPFASFTLPFVAAGAAGVAIATPVLIHLLSRQRFQVVHWAAMRFLTSAQKRHRKRIDHWPLMLMRVAVLALLLAGLCATAPWAESLWQSISPGAPESTSNAPRTHYVLVVDATLSMTAKNGDKTHFESSLAMAEEAIRDANPGDGFSIIVLAGGANVVVPGPANDPDKVLAELKSIKPTHLPGDMMSVVTAVSEIVSRSPRNYPRRQVTIFTDLQRSAWTTVLPNADRPPPDTWQRILGRAEVAFVDVAKRATDNLAVTDLTLADPLPLVDSRATVTATVQNFGRTDRRGVRVELLMGRPSAKAAESNLLPVEQKVIESIPPGERSTVSFAIEGARRFREAGLHILQVRLVEGDELPTDDTRNMVVNVRTGLNCLVVNGKPSSEPLRRSAGYLTEALAPGGRPIPENPARPRVVSLAEFADTGIGDVMSTDCAFVCDAPTLTPTHIAKLESILKRGGGVVIGLGPNAAANLDFYNRVLFDSKTGIASLKLLQVVSTNEVNDPGFRLTAAEELFRKPPLDAFRDDNSRGGLTAVPFKKYVKVKIPTEGFAQKLLSFAPANPILPSKGEADPAFIEIPKYRGRLFVYTSSFNSDWTDWPVLPSYLPFVHELLRYAATAPDRHTIVVGETLEDFASASSIGSSAIISGPDGLTATIPLATTDEGAVVRFPDTTLAGLYRVSLTGKHDGVFAVNSAERPGSGGSESDLRRVDSSEVKSISPAIQIVESPRDVRIQTDDGSGNKTVVTPKPHGPTISRWVLTFR